MPRARESFAMDGMHACVAPSEPAPVLRRWYTTAQAADYLGISPNALLHHVCRGRLEPDCRGRRGRSKQHMFSRERLDAFVLGEDTR